MCSGFKLSFLSINRYLFINQFLISLACTPDLAIVPIIEIFLSGSREIELREI